jgi:hypothetical protein
MNISVIGITKANLMDVITDRSVYVIKKRWTRDSYDMTPIEEADVKDLFSEDVLIVRITKE